MALLRLFLPAALVALLGGCGAASVSGLPSENQQLVAAPQTTARASEEIGKQKDAPTANEEAGVRKVALSLSAVSDPESKAYKIGPLDVLEVSVFKVPELSKTVQVSESGTISYPLIGEMEAGGKTSREVEQKLTALLGAKYLQHPQISVFVKEYHSQRITIEGAVKRPDVYPIAGGLTLLQATAIAGGFESSADEKVLLFRKSDGRRYAARYDVSSIREGRAEDPQLEAGDVIISSTSDVKEGMNTLFKFLPLATIVPLL